MARDKWVELYMPIICNMCKQYLPCNVNGDICFDATKDVNIRLYILSACQNQIVGDANLCLNA